MALYPVRRQFTVDEYHQMAQAGILSEDDRVELIDGEVIRMTPIGRRHAGCVNRLNDRLTQTFRDVALVAVQNPIQLGEFTEPQPDLALLPRRPDFFTGSLPTPADVFLLIEVAETSADFDRRIKVLLYARSGILEVWLVDLGQETVTAYQDPTSDGYRTVRVARRGEELAPLAFPDRPIPVNTVLG